MIEIIVWPLAVVVVFATFCLIFRKPIARLIERISRAGYGDKSIEFALPTSTAEQQKVIPAPTEVASAATVPAQAAAPPTSEVYAGIEKEIFDAIKSANFPPELERAWLVRGIAATRVARAHEIAYRLILGSQINLLLAANSSAPPDMEAVRAAYEAAKSSFPSVYENFSFDTWLNWPINSGLLMVDQSNPARSILRITPTGQDFLHYLVTNSLTSHKAG